LAVVRQNLTHEEELPFGLVRQSPDLAFIVPSQWLLQATSQSRTISPTRQLMDESTHQEVLGWVLASSSASWVAGRQTIGIVNLLKRNLAQRSGASLNPLSNTA
jgi:hypothetical protein